MKLEIDGNYYDVIIEKKASNRNTYIRVKKDLTILVTTNRFTTNMAIKRLIKDNYDKIVKMLEVQLRKKANNEGFYYLGKKYEIVYVDDDGISFDGDKVYFNEDFDIYKWYKKQAKDLFLEHFNRCRDNFSRKIPAPSLRIREMTSRWGVCNIRSHVITLNLELIKRDTKYLDYVIIHELSHLKYGDHSRGFWSLVEENMSDYKKYREEMKEF